MQVLQEIWWSRVVEFFPGDKPYRAETGQHAELLSKLADTWANAINVHGLIAVRKQFYTRTLKCHAEGSKRRGSWAEITMQAVFELECGSGISMLCLEEFSSPDLASTARVYYETLEALSNRVQKWQMAHPCRPVIADFEIRGRCVQQIYQSSFPHKFLGEVVRYRVSRLLFCREL